MKIYINDFSINCALGDNKKIISDALFSSHLNNPSDFTFVDGLKTKIFEIKNTLPKIPTCFKKYDSRNNRLVLSALNEMEEKISFAITNFGAKRIGVIIGTCTSGILEGIEATKNIKNGQLPSDYEYAVQEMGSPSLFIKDFLKLDSVAYTISTACSSGARAVIEGKRLIENNICDAVIVGGSDTLNELTLNGFYSLESISHERTNPFSINRSGINIGEGVALFLLSKQPSEYELLGVGESTDAYHISSPDPSGSGAINAMKMALDEAQISFESIDYINLHGTGTIKNDEMESIAVNQLFPHKPLVSSTKPLVGHTLGAAGAIEMAFCLLSMKEKMIPIHHWDGEVDSKLQHLNFVSPSDKCSPRICMSNSYAFGGNNASIIVGVN